MFTANMRGVVVVLLQALLAVACSAPAPDVVDDVPAGEQASPALANQCVHELGQTCPLQPRACGCADMTEYEVPAGGCFAIAYGGWGSIEDDIACFDLTPNNATPEDCTRTCAGYFEAMNPTNAPIKIKAFDKLTQSKPGMAQPGSMTKDVEQCSRMFNGPQEADYYKNMDPFVTDPSGLLVRYKGGPKATTFPAPGSSICPSHL